MGDVFRKRESECLRASADLRLILGILCFLLNLLDIMPQQQWCWWLGRKQGYLNEPFLPVFFSMIGVIKSLGAKRPCSGGQVQWNRLAMISGGDFTNGGTILATQHTNNQNTDTKAALRVSYRHEAEEGDSGDLGRG